MLSNLKPMGLFLLAALLASCSGGGPSSAAKSSTSSSGSSSSSIASTSTSSTSSSSSSSASASSSSQAPPGTGVPPPPPPAAGGTDHVTFRFDTARDGWNGNESVLTLQNVNAASFGLLHLLPVDGKVDAQPLYLSQLTIGGKAHNVVFAATENDSVYAFDADSGAQLWKTSLVPAGEKAGDGHGCDEVVPTIGVTSTPVIDRHAGTHGEIFLVAMTSNGAGVYHHRLHALDVSTGAEVPGSPTEVSASYPKPGPGSGTSTSFDPGQYEERAALLLSGGTIYTSWTSHCDATTYTGWVIGFSEKTLQQNALGNVAPNGTGGPSIWMSGNGPAADAEGNLYVLTANGEFETVLDGNGFPAGGDFGNSFVKISTAGGQLAVADYFAIYNTQTLTNEDMDLGSGGEVLLPDMKDATGTVRHLVVGAGKDGNIYLVDRDAMGKWSPKGNNIWQQLTGVIPGGVWSTPAYFNGVVYYSEQGSTIKAFGIANAKLIAQPISQTAINFVYPGGAPAVSSSGADNAIVWAHENTTPAVLHAYDASNLAKELYNSNQAPNARDRFGGGNKFITPAIADGKVFVGTTNAVAVFGLLH